MRPDIEGRVREIRIGQDVVEARTQEEGFVVRQGIDIRLTSLEVVVNLIANTTTDVGLTIEASLDSKEYPTGIRVSDKEIKAINLVKDDFHGEWNYSIAPSIIR